MIENYFIRYCFYVLFSNVSTKIFRRPFIICLFITKNDLIRYNVLKVNFTFQFVYHINIIFFYLCTIKL